METDLLAYTIALIFGLATRFAAANRALKGNDIPIVVHFAICCLGFFYDCPLFVLLYVWASNLPKGLIEHGMKREYVIALVQVLYWGVFMIYVFLNLSKDAMALLGGLLGCLFFVFEFASKDKGDVLRIGH